MSDDENTRLTTEEARGAEVHDRSWLIAGIVIAAVVVLIAFIFI